MPILPATGAPYQGFPTTSPEIAVPPDTFSIQANPTMFGALQGQALERFGGQLKEAGNEFAAVAIAKQQLYNQVIADDQTNQYQKFENNLLRGDPDHPETKGFFQLRGEEAMRAYPNVSHMLISKREEMRNALPNAHAQLAFDQETRRLQSYSLASMGQHYDTESRLYGDVVAKDKYANAQADLKVALQSGDQAAIEQALTRMREALGAQSANHGTGGNPEVKKANDRQVNEEYNYGQIEAAAQVDPLAGFILLQQHPELHGDKYDELYRRLEAASRKQRALIDAGILPKPPNWDENLKKLDTISQQPKADLEPYATGNAKSGGPSPWTGLQPITQQRIAAAVAAMPPDVKQEFKIISGYRSDFRQHQVNPSVTNSHHTSGIAFDVAPSEKVIQWFADNPQFGLGFPEVLASDPKERNHVEVMNYDSATHSLTRIEPGDQAAFVKAHGGGHEPVRQAAGQLAAANTNVVSPEVIPVAGHGPIPDEPTPMPVLNFVPPPYEPGEDPDDQVPGMAQAAEAIMKIPPEQTQRRLDAYAAARQFYNQQNAMKKQKLAEHEKELTVQAKQIENDYYKRFNTSNPPTEAEVWADPSIALVRHPEVKTQVVQAIRSLGKEDPADTTDSAKRAELFERINLPYGDPRKITSMTEINKAYAPDREIKAQSRDWLEKVFFDEKKKGGDNLARAKTRLINEFKSQIYGVGAVDQEGRELQDEQALREGKEGPSQRYARFLNDIEEAIDTQQNNNKSPADLFNQKSPDYLGNPERMKSYMPPLRDTLKPAVPVQIEQMDEKTLRGFRPKTGAEFDRAVKRAKELGIKIE